jgi:hypothetical protein
VAFVRTNGCRALIVTATKTSEPSATEAAQLRCSVREYVAATSGSSRPANAVSTQSMGDPHADRAARLCVGGDRGDRVA